MTLDYFYGQSGELFSYFRIPKALFQDSRFRQLSTDARTLYGILLDRMSLSVKNGWMDKQGRVYIIYTVREVQESLCCAEHKAVKLFRELEQIDLIERKRRGLGRPSLIYVKDFTTGLSKTRNLNCANSNSGVAQSAVQEPLKPQANKTDNNNTEMNKPDPIHSGDIREQLEDYFYQELEVELLLRLFPDDEDTIYQIVDLLVDTCATKRRIAAISPMTMRKCWQDLRMNWKNFSALPQIQRISLFPGRGAQSTGIRSQTTTLSCRPEVCCKPIWMPCPQVNEMF